MLGMSNVPLSKPHMAVLPTSLVMKLSLNVVFVLKPVDVE